MNELVSLLGDPSTAGGLMMVIGPSLVVVLLFEELFTLCGTRPSAMPSWTSCVGGHWRVLPWWSACARTSMNVVTRSREVAICTAP
ncbi:hypothetical protein C6Y14_43240 [Streptomyces dioscori]|uniref:Uncharacterized protein n=1 Tax=Streptomyces dioscori TaxID=2109333 RepID=A0A2P8PTF9_9ACTN|nr:hypothetical protein C6Y14_43240 [Streptomyces dioscori]